MKTSQTVNSLLNIADLHFKLSLRPMKLQKLLYFCCGEHYAKYNEWIINGDFYAWHYGPVYRPVYKAFQIYGSGYIKNYLEPETARAENKVNQTILNILKKYGDQDDISLSHITHQKGSPWFECYDKRKEVKITRQEIKKFFKENGN